MYPRVCFPSTPYSYSFHLCVCTWPKSHQTVGRKKSNKAFNAVVKQSFHSSNRRLGDRNVCSSEMRSRQIWVSTPKGMSHTHNRMRE